MTLKRKVYQPIGIFASLLLFYLNPQSPMVVDSKNSKKWDGEGKAAIKIALQNLSDK